MPYIYSGLGQVGLPVGIAVAPPASPRTANIKAIATKVAQDGVARRLPYDTIWKTASAAAWDYEGKMRQTTGTMEMSGEAVDKLIKETVDMVVKGAVPPKPPVAVARPAQPAPVAPVSAIARAQAVLDTATIRAKQAAQRVQIAQAQVNAKTKLLADANAALKAAMAKLATTRDPVFVKQIVAQVTAMKQKVAQATIMLQQAKAILASAQAHLRIAIADVEKAKQALAKAKAEAAAAIPVPPTPPRLILVPPVKPIPIPPKPLIPVPPIPTPPKPPAPPIPPAPVIQVLVDTVPSPDVPVTAVTEEEEAEAEVEVTPTILPVTVAPEAEEKKGFPTGLVAFGGLALIGLYMLLKKK